MPILNLDRARILGLTAGLGLPLIGELVEPKEAEAAPLPIKPKIGVRAFKRLAPEISSASSALEGKLIRGKPIKEVRKGKGDWRHIIFDDNSYMTLKKDWLATLTAETGRGEYIKAFKAGQPPPGRIERIMREVPSAKEAGYEKTLGAYIKAFGGPKGVRLTMAEKGLRAAHARRPLPTTKLTEKERVETIFKKLEKIDPSLINELAIVRYKGRYAIISKEYADLLSTRYPEKVRIVK